LLVGTHKDFIPESSVEEFIYCCNEKIENLRQKMKLSNLKEQIIVNSHDSGDKEHFKKTLLS
jgi:hypothetical protein